MKLQRGITAVVTGAANGIGRATSEALARQGCAIALVDIDERALKDTATRMLTAGHCVSSYVADVTDRQRISDLAREIAAQHETVEILINSAGVALSGRFEQLQLDDIAWLFEVNFWGVVYCSHCFLPLLKKAREAALVNVLSTLSLVGAPGKSAYCASKFAVRGLSESPGMELARSSVRVTNVYPGPVSTGIVRAGRAVGRKHSGGKRSFLPTEGWRPRSSRRRFSQPSSAARAA